MNFVIIGHARHGKDTVAEFMQADFGFKFQSSSQAAADIFLYQKLKEKYGYQTPEECFEDRMNHRAEWHDEIVAYNTPDKSRLAKDIMKENDIYVGMRSNEELAACIKEGVFDMVIGVYNPILPFEDETSFNIDLMDNADVIITNDGSLSELHQHVNTQIEWILENN